MQAGGPAEGHVATRLDVLCQEVEQLVAPQLHRVVNDRLLGAALAQQIYSIHLGRPTGSNRRRTCVGHSTWDRCKLAIVGGQAGADACRVGRTL